MANTKLTNLSAGTSVAHDDLFVMVDVSDATMDAAGTNVKVQAKNLLRRVVNAQVGTSYTLALVDSVGILTMTNASAIEITIPQDSTLDFPVGCQIAVFQGAAGKVSFKPEGGTATLRTKAVGSRASVTKTGADAWYINGDLETF